MSDDQKIPGSDEHYVYLKIAWPKGQMPTESQFRGVKDLLGDAFMAQIKGESE
jgi:hypothetical protein